jgi:hypothetical protein
LSRKDQADLWGSIRKLSPHMRAFGSLVFGPDEIQDAATRFAVMRVVEQYKKMRYEASSKNNSNEACIEIEKSKIISEFNKKYFTYDIRVRFLRGNITKKSMFEVYDMKSSGRDHKVWSIGWMWHRRVYKEIISKYIIPSHFILLDAKKIKTNQKDIIAHEVRAINVSRMSEIIVYAAKTKQGYETGVIRKDLKTAINHTRKKLQNEIDKVLLGEKKND